MNTLNRFIVRAGVVATGITAPFVVFAQGFQGSNVLLGKIGEKAGTGTADLPTLIGRIINVVMGFIGVILLFYILYAGFLWMTAGGEEKKTTEAKNMIKNAIIGLVILVAAVAISNFVISQLTTATTG